MGEARVLLASGSPRRRELLERLGVPVDVVVPEVDERAGLSETPEELVRRLAGAKADAAVVHADPGPGMVVVAGDTVVVLDGVVLGKPADRSTARGMLDELGGRTHRVVSGYVVRTRQGATTRALTVAVTFVGLDSTTIDWYLGTGEWRGKAGAYAIQGRGAALVASIVGDPATVIGLPLSAVVADARRLGVDLLRQGGGPVG